MIEPHPIERQRPPSASTMIFRGPELLAKDLRQHISAYRVMTFESNSAYRTLDRPGFGEAFLDANDIDAFHIIPRKTTGTNIRRSMKPVGGFAN